MTDREELAILWRATGGKDIHGKPVPRVLVERTRNRQTEPGGDKEVGQISGNRRKRKSRAEARRDLIPSL